jgi:hypothetical protein
MSNSNSRRFPVTVTQLALTRCQICHYTIAYRPGNLSELLTEHYRRAHPNCSPSAMQLGRLPSRDDLAAGRTAPA